MRARFGTIAVMQMRMIIGIITICLSLGSGFARAGGMSDDAQIYATPQSYVAAQFQGHTPEQQSLWPDAQLREVLSDVLGHRPSLRFKYWGADGKTVWVLDEIGKDRPITAGVTIADGRIADVKVLVFRESRGWEVKHDFFTRQFANLFLRDSHDLSDKIDNITGATLSVKAMTRMAKAALLMHAHTGQANATVATAR